MLIELADATFGYRRRPVVRVSGLHLHAGRIETAHVIVEAQRGIEEAGNS